MARVSKTSPFQPKPNKESEKKDEEKSDSSSSTSSTSSDQNTQDKKQEKAKGKKPMQDKTRKRKMPLYRSIKRGRWRGKVEAFTARLWRKNHPRVDVHISSDDEPNNVDPKPKGTQDNMQEKIKGKRPMQAVGLGRGKSLAYTARLLGEHHRRLASKKSNIDHLEVKEDKEEEVVYLSSETDSDEVCKRIKLKRHNNDDADNNGQGTGTYTNLTSFGVQVVGK